MNWHPDSQGILSTEFEEKAPMSALSPHKAPRCLALYETRLKPLLEPMQNGQVVAIHPDSEDYVVAPTSGDAMRAMYQRHPEGQVLLHLIGTSSADSGLAARMLGTRLLAR